MKIFYYTATGNSLDVAKRIGGQLYSIPQLLKENNYTVENLLYDKDCSKNIIIDIRSKLRF